MDTKAIKERQERAKKQFQERFGTDKLSKATMKELEASLNPPPIRKKAVKRK